MVIKYECLKPLVETKIKAAVDEAQNSAMIKFAPRI